MTNKKNIRPIWNEERINLLKKIMEKAESFPDAEREFFKLGYYCSARQIRAIVFGFDIPSPNLKTLKGPYYWAKERIEILREVYLIAKSHLEAYSLAKARGIKAPQSTITTLCSLFQMEHPHIHRGGYRWHKIKGEKVINGKTIS